MKDKDNTTDWVSIVFDKNNKIDEEIIEDDVILDGEGNNILSITFRYKESFAEWIIDGYWQRATKEQILKFAEELIEAANKMEDE